MRSIIMLIIGLVAGYAISMAVMIYTMPSQMLNVSESNFSFEETVAMIQDGATANGWKVPKVYDMQKSLAGAGHEIDRLNVISLCNPDHAYTILSANERKRIAAMMPCRVGIYETTDGKVYVTQMNTGMLSSMFGGVIEETMGVVATEMDQFVKPVLKSDN